MSEFIEQLESRQLFSTSYPAAGTYTGFAIPKGHASQAAYTAALGVKKNGARASATLKVAIAGNSILTGSLVLENNTYILSGNIVGVYVSATIDLNGSAVGTFAGKLKQLNKKLIGPLTDTLNVGGTETVTTAQMNLTNSAAIPVKKSGGGKKKQNLALAPGFQPNQTPPPITSGNTNNSIGNQTGLTGGDNSGTGTISSGDSGSILG